MPGAFLWHMINNVKRNNTKLVLFKRKKIDLRLFVFYWKSYSGATVQAWVLHLWSFKAGVRNQFLTPANSHSMLFPTILSIDKKTRLSSSLFDEVSFLLPYIYVAKNPAHLCGAGILISFVKVLVCGCLNTSRFFDKKTTSTPKKTETQNYHIW